MYGYIDKNLYMKYNPTDSMFNKQNKQDNYSIQEITNQPQYEMTKCIHCAKQVPFLNFCGECGNFLFHVSFKKEVLESSLNPQYRLVPFDESYEKQNNIANTITRINAATERYIYKLYELYEDKALKMIKESEKLNEDFETRIKGEFENIFEVILSNKSNQSDITLDVAIVSNQEKRDSFKQAFYRYKEEYRRIMFQDFSSKMDKIKSILYNFVKYDVRSSDKNDLYIYADSLLWEFDLRLQKKYREVLKPRLKKSLAEMWKKVSEYLQKFDEGIAKKIQDSNEIIDTLKNAWKNDLENSNKNKSNTDNKTPTEQGEPFGKSSTFYKTLQDILNSEIYLEHLKDFPWQIPMENLTSNIEIPYDTLKQITNQI